MTKAEYAEYRDVFPGTECVKLFPDYRKEIDMLITKINNLEETCKEHPWLREKITGYQAQLQYKMDALQNRIAGVMKYRSM